MEKTEWKGKFISVTTEEKYGQVWERAYIPSGIVVFPVTDEGKILVIIEKRPHEVPELRLKFVSGMLEHNQSSAETANRELQEEIGFKAREIIPVWSYRGTGTVNSSTEFFLAKGLTPSKLPNPDGEDAIQQIIPLALEELREKVENEELRWGVGVMGFLRLDLALRRGTLSLT